MKTLYDIIIIFFYNFSAVATGFPSGHYSLKTRLEEIKSAVTDGANEIDIVINRSLALAGDWQGKKRFFEQTAFGIFAVF